MSASRRGLLIVTGLPLAFVSVLAVQALMTTRREYLETPEFEIDGTLQPAGAQVGGRPLRMVMLGDSTVAGLGSDSVEESLVFQTGQRVADLTGRPVAARGYGVSGARTADVRDDQLPELDGEVDVVVIVIGSNDVTHFAPPWRMDDLTASMLTAAREHGGGAPIVLGGIPLFGEARAFAEPLRSVVDGYASLLRRPQRSAANNVEGVTYVDIAREASPRFVGVDGAMSSDEFHPGAIGYGFWADALAPAIAAAVESD